MKPYWIVVSVFTLLCIATLAAGCTSKPQGEGGYSNLPFVVTIELDGDTAEVVFPTSVGARFRKAVEEMRVGHWKAAQEKLSILVIESPSNWAFRYALAVSFEGGGSTELARSNYRQALTLEGANRFYCEAGLARIAGQRR